MSSTVAVMATVRSSTALAHRAKHGNHEDNDSAVLPTAVSGRIGGSPDALAAGTSYGRADAITTKEKAMSAIKSTVLDDAIAQELSERLADVFRTAEVGDVLTEDVFLDGHPPLWRFQMQGRDAIAAWLKGYTPDGAETTVVRTIPTVTGFVTELVGRHHDDGHEMTDRKIVLCELRAGRIAELTVYCSGDWDAELRARHAAQASLIRP
jgi:ketosteroid isomerase-like protein